MLKNAIKKSLAIGVKHLLRGSLALFIMYSVQLIIHQPQYNWSVLFEVLECN